MFNVIKKSLGKFIDENDMLNPEIDFKSVTHCLRTDLGKLMMRLNENVISSLSNFLQTNNLQPHLFSRVLISFDVLSRIIMELMIYLMTTPSKLNSKQTVLYHTYI